MAVSARIGTVLTGFVALVIAGCSAPAPSVRHSASATPAAKATSTPNAATAALPPYAIATLRQRPHAKGAITVTDVVGPADGYAKYHVKWMSDGNPMTGVLDVPTGDGPFPVVLVNHGYAPVSQYYEGLDTASYADPMASAGFMTISPSYPGYLGSGPPAPNVPSIVAEAIADLDLIAELPTLPKADPTRVAVAGHSNGGGVAEILMAAAPGLRAAVLYAPVSSDFADNARKWWARSASSGSGGSGVPNPDTNPTAYQQMSPRPYYGPNTPPALIMQGTNDEDIPADWTAATVQYLQAVGAHTQFVSFPGATHIFAGSDLARANSLAIDWLRSWMR